MLKGTRRSSQLAVDAVTVAVLCNAASLALPTGITGTKTATLSLASVVLIVLGCDDFHLSRKKGGVLPCPVGEKLRSKGEVK
jgi:hypothetical protein